MIRPRPWEEFRAAGLLWWVNRGLHLFGWVICVEVDPGGVIQHAYPARTKFRGFSEEDETRGFEDLTFHLAREAPALLDDISTPLEDIALGEEAKGDE
jgi:hypothetical protein